MKDKEFTSPANEADRRKGRKSLSKRQKAIISVLVQMGGQPVTLSAISEKLSVSSRTILRELSVVEEWMSENDFRFVRKRGTGVALEETPENKGIVKDKLIKYIDETTKYIGQSGYSDTVRSIDIFNELPNRFPLEGDTPYKYRGDIEQTKDASGVVPDNIKSGWSKHLSIEDLCDAATVARTNLPDTDFMYNDDNLTDPAKLAITKDIISEVQSYEQEHSVKLIDSIGTQMHLDNDVTSEEIENMFKELSEYGLPIEITEFDLAMTQNVEGLTDEEIEVLRQQKMNEIISCIESLQEEYNIRGLTICSKTDSQNFRVKLANEELLTSGNEPIDTLHGGYFTEEMTPKSEQLEEMIDVNETTQEIEKIVENAKIKYDVIEISVVHYIGEFYTGDTLFLVAVLGKHRKESLDALNEVIEKVKFEVEFKKEEISKQGSKTILAGG